jgi:hypothetical protein
MASLRNLAIGILRRAGRLNIAKALRHNVRDASRPLALLGIMAEGSPRLNLAAVPGVPSSHG